MLLAAALLAACGAASVPSDAGTDAGGPLVLLAGESRSADVVASAGGVVTSADGLLTLTIPPGALARDETITIVDVGGPDELIWVLQPDGTTFSLPVAIRVELPDPSPAIVTLLHVSPDGVASGVAIDLVPDGTAVVGEIGHFSTLAVPFDTGMTASLAAERPWAPPDGTHLSTGLTEITGSIVRSGTSTFPATLLPAVTTITSAQVERASWRATGLGVLSPPDQPVGAEFLGAGAVASSTATVVCMAVGDATIHADLVVRGTTITAVTEPLRIETLEAITLGNLLTGDITVPFVANFEIDAAYVCDAVSPMVRELTRTSTTAEEAIMAGDKVVNDGAETKLSDRSRRRPPDPAERIERTLDPLLELSDAAARRIFDVAFPCGPGPVGLTVCADPGTPAAAGQWVFLMNTLGADVPIADPVGIYQHAFVFDADSIASNNYLPAPAFPGDFFAGTDLWYELTYSPAAGWAVRVRDVRLGLADVPSQARFVLAGNHVGFFVPRAELDGVTPAFRTTAFRHEGDYGLRGGPWSGDYYPLLGEPLLPAAGVPIPISD
jgi:hypothetical protein